VDHCVERGSFRWPEVGAVGIGHWDYTCLIDLIIREPYNLLITQDRPGGPRKKTHRFYPEIMVREKLKSWTSTALLSFKEELRDFLRATGGAGDVALADGFAGLRALEVAAAVRESTLRNGVVQLPALGRMTG
jgi:hypothetical protein